MRLPRRTLLVGAAAAALTLAGCSSGETSSGGGESSTSGTATEPTKVTVSQVSGIVTNAALALGVEQGFFADEGLDPQVTDVPNPPAALAAVQGGQTDIAYTPSTSLLTALSQGVGLKVIAAGDGYSPDSSSDEDTTGLYAPAGGATELSDLAGKKVAIPARKAQLEVVVSGVLDDAGVDVGSIEWVTLDFQSALSALQSGQVDAASLVEPFGAQASASGATLISSPSQGFFEQGAVGLWVTSDQTADDEKDVVEAFARAIYKSNAYANDHLDEAKQKSIDLNQQDITPDQVVATYWPPTVDEADLDRAGGKLVKLGFLDSPADLTGVILPQP